MHETIRKILIEDFNFPLKETQIAQFPLEKRDNSKLLVLKDTLISEDVFSSIAHHLPADSLMISNETRVVHARLLFKKPSGTPIEIFCLEPVSPTNDIQLAFEQKNTSIWKCLVGNARRWKSGTLEQELKINGTTVKLNATMLNRDGATFLVELTWSEAEIPFATILEHFGKIPLPPYISRPVSETDNIRYQTVFARNDGSVAAPTAGLHFTNEVLVSLNKKNIKTASVTLHVGAGTFKPVSTETIGEHQMHHEQVIVPLHLIKEIIRYKSENRNIILVGTTTVRTLESVYWQGVKWLNEQAKTPLLHTEQWDPYSGLPDMNIPTVTALQSVIDTLEKSGLTELRGDTSLMIAPGYTYHIPDAIITNFHQPQSTLLLLVAAFVGPLWKTAYEYALGNNFRFLSYGDSCLFFKHQLE